VKLIILVVVPYVVTYIILVDAVLMKGNVTNSNTNAKTNKRKEIEEDENDIQLVKKKEDKICHQ